jgi:hypothetical protein
MAKGHQLKEVRDKESRSLGCNFNGTLTYATDHSRASYIQVRASRSIGHDRKGGAEGPWRAVGTSLITFEHASKTPSIQLRSVLLLGAAVAALPCRSPEDRLEQYQYHCWQLNQGRNAVKVKHAAYLIHLLINRQLSLTYTVPNLGTV